MQNTTAEESSRRKYWTQQMDAGYEFMNVVLDLAVEETGEPLRSLRDAVKDAGLTVEFSQTRIAGEYDRIFYLREGLIHDFMGAAADMNERGWVLKVEDGFRSRAMQKSLALADHLVDAILRKVIWELEGAVPDADVFFRRLTVLIATCPKIGTHMSGSAIDISVLNADDRSELDRGGPYLEMSELTPMGSPFVSAEAQRNRAEISSILKNHGFLAYPQEFWHYSKGDAYSAFLSGSNSPAKYGPVDFDPVSGSTTPIPDPRASMHAPADVAQQIRSALGRLAR